MANDEIIGGPFEVWQSPANTAAPNLDDVPASPWVIMGVSGNKNITEDGIRITNGITGEAFRALGTLGARKWFPTAQDLNIAFELADMTAEMYAAALGRPVGDIVTVAAASGIPGSKSIDIERSFVPEQFALLIRGDQSPGGVGFNTQWWVPLVVQTGNPEIIIVKGVPQLLAFNYMALVDNTNGLGKFQVQTAAALP